MNFRMSVIVAAIAAAIASPAAAREMSVAAPAAALAYQVSQHSPLLSASRRTAISQDFNGVPLARAPRVHAVAAERVACRARQPSLGEATECTITYAKGKRDVALTGADARSLFDAMGAAGVETEAGMGHLERTITALRCSVDDKVAQDTPSSGDLVAGFSCRFAAED